MLHSVEVNYCRVNMLGEPVKPTPQPEPAPIVHVAPPQEAAPAVEPVEEIVEQTEAEEIEETPSDMPIIPPGVTPSIGLYVTSGPGGGVAARAITPLVANGLVSALSGGGRFETANRTNDINRVIGGPTQDGNLTPQQMRTIASQLDVHFLCIVRINFGAGGSFGLHIEFVNAPASRNITTIDMANLNRNTVAKTMLDIGRELLETLKDVGGAPTSVQTAETGSGAGAGQTASSGRQERGSRDDRESRNRVTVGAGGIYSGDYGGGIRWDGNVDGAIAMPYNGGGFMYFIDLIYVKIPVAFSGGSGEWKTRNNVGSRELPNMRRSVMTMGAFLKTPSTTRATGDVKLFPLVGLEYEMVRAELHTGEEVLEIISADDDNLSALWFKFGGGLNVGLSRNWHFRTEALYGWRTANNFEKNNAKDYGGSTRLGHGLTLRATLGFNLMIR